MPNNPVTLPTFSSSADPNARFQAAEVTRVIKNLAAPTQRETKRRWLQAVASRVVTTRPDLARGLLDLLGVDPLDEDPLKGCSIGEIGVCYEALLAGLNANTRRSSGQYFTPDDIARFMAERSSAFPEGVWMDPCCGVGNLAWHLAAAQAEPGAFVRDRLVLADRDGDAMKSAVAIIAADYLADGDHEGLMALSHRAVKRDFLDRSQLPYHDYVIVNPPYARAPKRTDFETGAARELFSYFIERIAKFSRGFISVTPASYLSAPKFQNLRTIVDENTRGGRVFVFDNVPDTLFRGYKFGSSNTSTTNFVRAAITVCSPSLEDWETTPIIRWRSASRARMLNGAAKLLGPRYIGPNGEWTKLGPGLGDLWSSLAKSPEVISDLIVAEPTEHRLTVALTPRYFISAAFRDLERGSKTYLHFESIEDLNRAALVLNSSIPYLWWRVLDGGVTLPKRVLASVPVPHTAIGAADLIAQLRATEESSIVTKLNAGSINENVKRPRELVRSIDEHILGKQCPDFGLLYSEDMFGAREPNSLD